MRLTRFKISMHRKGISQQEIAKKLDISDATVSRIANGWKVPDEELKTKLAGLLGQRVEYLWPPKRMGKAS